MKSKMKLLAIGIAIMIVSSGIAAFILQTVGNKKPPASSIRWLAKSIDDAAWGMFVNADGGESVTRM